MKSWRRIGVVLSVLWFVPTASAQTVNWGAKSALLDQGMSEQRVINVLGYRPNKVELKTCGQSSGDKPWTCKTHTYGYISQDQLLVFFVRSDYDGNWIVNSWYVFP